jgi:ubiquinol-cytochrome c reductase iron-sulfur subunit
MESAILTAPDDLGRRRLLAQATAIAGAAALLAVTSPFIASFAPSRRARVLSAPVEVDVSLLEPGAMITIPWRGQPVWVVRRTPGMLRQLDAARPFLLDPDSAGSLQPEYARNETRARNPEYLVLLGVCTHLGCTPEAKFQASEPTMQKDWPGGFFCQCHGSKYDLAGRVFKGVPAPTNLTVPPYRFVSPGRILVGSDDTQAA